MEVAFATSIPDDADTLLVGVAEGRVLMPGAQQIDALTGGAVTKVASVGKFTGKRDQTVDIVAPEGVEASRIVVLGLGDFDTIGALGRQKLGGGVVAHLNEVGARHVAVLTSVSAESAEFVYGVKLRSYQFDKYRTKQKEEDLPTFKKLTMVCADPKAGEAHLARLDPVADGVKLARDLVSEPANTLFPAEFAKRASELSKLGVDVEVLNEQRMGELGMGALLGVGQGSAHESQLVVMRWEGGGNGAPWLAVVGKGVCFDAGGISIKPAAGMEDMKFDMAGAACVTGLMHALAARAAKANVVGIIGCVENMPSGKAQRPGDVVTTMSGQTIEVINTDAEGRLVLADALYYAVTTFKPKQVIDLATLTGAIIVALGQEHAGLFANNDELAERLLKAGEETGEKVWRMPLAPEYDKLIDSKFADVKNTGGRNAGSITAAQFLQRFVDQTPWAHLDIAGTGMGSPQSDINKSWASGWGVRLLDQLVAANYEK